MIYWIGNSENWDKPAHPLGDPEHRPFVFPLVEEVVLEVAFSKLYVPFKRLSREAAINCTSRLALRKALRKADGELNPEWLCPTKVTGPFDGLVVKAPASCQNQGIGFAVPNEYSRRLAQYDPEMAAHGVVEQYIPGPQYEADGIVIEGKVRLLAWTRQEGDNGKIVRYVPLIYPILPEAPTEVIETAVKALGLDNCPFCFEMKRQGNQWKVIDAHARLGEGRNLWYLYGAQSALFDRIDRIISGEPQPSLQL